MTFSSRLGYPYAPDISRLVLSLEQRFSHRALDSLSFNRLSPALWLYAVLRLLSGHDLSSFVLRATALAETRQISLGKTNELRVDPVANTHADTNRYWTSLPSASLSAGCALQHFTCVRDRHASMTSFRPPLAGLTTLASLRESRGAPQQSPCLLDVGFPLSGPRVWTFTSCSLIMPVTRMSAHEGCR